MNQKKHPHLNRPTGPYIRLPWERHRQITVIDDESMTDTSFGNETNINNIISRFSRTGILPGPGDRQPQYEDVTHLQVGLTQLINDGNAAAARSSAARQALQKAKENLETAEKQELEQTIERLKQQQQPTDTPS